MLNMFNTQVLINLLGYVSKFEKLILLVLFNQYICIFYTSQTECHESGGTLFLSIWTAADKQVSSSVFSTQMLVFVKIDR